MGCEFRWGSLILALGCFEARYENLMSLITDDLHAMRELLRSTAFKGVRIHLSNSAEGRVKAEIYDPNVRKPSFTVDGEGSSRAVEAFLENE